MSKTAKINYVCAACGAVSSKWSGQCGDCGEWNTLTEQRPISATRSNQRVGYAGEVGAVTRLSEVATQSVVRTHTGLEELDRVLGGGLVEGSVVLIGGDPGIGKSTILLQTMTQLAQHLPALYITGEESLAQVALRARRLELPMDQLQLMAETRVENILATAAAVQPRVMVVDSIQTIYTDTLTSAPGGCHKFVSRQRC